MAVRIKSRHVVKPAEPTWQGIFPLSELDHIGVITHASILYFYERPTQDYWLDPSNNKILQTLKDSLSRALVPFYPFAGRLSLAGGGRHKLECNAMGAELTEFESDLTISDFGDFITSSHKTFQELLPHIDHYVKPIEELPLLAVQVTRFACGGMSLGIELSHVIADGKSSFHFIEEWARLARGEPLGVEPYLDRRVLIAEIIDRLPQGDIREPMPHLGEPHNSDERPKKVLPTYFVITKDEIERLKQVANNKVAHETGRPFSRFEVIAAHIWRFASKARGLKSEEVTTLSVVVDSRGRMEPPLPSSYFGNAVFPTSSSTHVGELISRPLSYACQKVREAIKQLTTEHIFQTIQFFNKQHTLSNYQIIEDRGSLIEGPTNGDNNVSITSWMNLAARDVNFGWGKEIFVRPPTGAAYEGDTVIFPHKNNDGSMVVAMWLQPKQKLPIGTDVPLRSKI